jgi:hypothetical protein
MKLLRLEDVRVSSADAVFRQSPWHTGIFSALLFAVAAGACVLAVVSDDAVGRWMFGFGTAFLGLLGLFVFSLFRKTLGPANWLVRVAPGGDMTVKFRSYANAHFPAEDRVAFTLAPREIRWVRLSTDRTIRSADRGVRQDRRRYLDVAVDESIAAQIDEQLKLERGRQGPETGRFVKGRSKLLDYPVSVADRYVIRIEWRGPSTWITPRLPKAVDLLARHAPVEPSVDEGVRDLSSATPEDASEKIRALAESGDEIGAIELARKVYGGSIADARETVKRLSGGPDGSSPVDTGKA